MTSSPQSFIECTGDLNCPERPNQRFEDDGVYTTEEVAEMRGYAIILGFIWMGLSYVPISAWYMWRRPGIRAMKDLNPWYHRAWNTMWMSHYFVFQLPAIIAPLSYFGNLSINQFYMFLNFWVGTVGGAIAATITTITFLIAYLTFTNTDDLLKQHVAAEIVGYIFLTFGLWNIASQQIVPPAYEWLQLSVPKTERNYQPRDGEGSENLEPQNFLVF